MRQFLLQMTGESGTGKSTLARAIGRETRAVVLDKDIIKSRILDGDEFGLDGLSEAVAAPLHHSLVYDLCGSFLDQGFSVVIDGAAFFSLVRIRGRALAETSGACYFLIECVLPELAILQRRIDAKELLSSQPRVASLSGYSRPGTGPLTEPHLTVDTRWPLEVCVEHALEYLRS